MNEVTYKYLARSATGIGIAAALIYEPYGVREWLSVALAATAVLVFAFLYLNRQYSFLSGKSGRENEQRTSQSTEEVESIERLTPEEVHLQLQQVAHLINLPAARLSDPRATSYLRKTAVLTREERVDLYRTLMETHKASNPWPYDVSSPMIWTGKGQWEPALPQSKVPHKGPAKVEKPAEMLTGFDGGRESLVH